MSIELLHSFINRYLTKKEIMYRIPSSENIDDFWSKLIDYRKSFKIDLPLLDQDNNNFWFIINDSIKDNIRNIDNMATQDLFTSIPENIENAIIADALIDEAFNSSVIEGAFSTKKRTKEMIEKKIKPTDKSEQMIVNNHQALEFILENKHYPLDENIILCIYNILTNGTLDEDDIIEKYRRGAVYVWDSVSQTTIYTAPPYTEVQSLMNSLIEFINTNNDIHPIVKACIIHFYFVYIHPFFDGNGRTARAISYMYLLQNGYDFFKFFSISSVVREEKKKYYKSIKDVEDYSSDLTYFISYYTEMILHSIKNILDRFKKEFGYRIIRTNLERKGIILSERQSKALEYYIKGQKNFTTIDEYEKKYKVAYETARTDLNQFEFLGIFEKSKIGKKFIYKILDFKKINDNLQNLNNSSQ